MCEKRFHFTFELRGMLQPSPSSSMLDHGQRAGDRAWMEPFFARPTYPTAVSTNIDEEGEGSAETTAYVKKWNLFSHTAVPRKHGCGTSQRRNAKWSTTFLQALSLFVDRLWTVFTTEVKTPCKPIVFACICVHHSPAIPLTPSHPAKGHYAPYCLYVPPACIPSSPLSHNPR